MARRRHFGPLIAVIGILMFVVFGVVTDKPSEADSSYCDESSESVARARALTHAELKSIHQYMFSGDQIESGRIGEFLDAPQELVELEPTSLLKGGPRPSVGLESCSIDYKVGLIFNRPGSGEKFVTLHWGGDLDKSFEKLWESTSTDD